MSSKARLGRDTAGSRCVALRSPPAAVPSGFALLAVLWVMVGVATLMITASLSGRDAMAAARNRVALRRAEWVAEGCVARVQSAATAMIDENRAIEDAWPRLDLVLAGSPLVGEGGCSITVRAEGSRLDINHADEGALAALFTALGADSARADSLTDALLDWRDADDEPRPHGAERPWYRSETRVQPRNGDIADPRELALIRGFEGIGGLDSVLGAGEGRIVLARAPLPVLATLPGFDAEALAYVADRRALGEPVGDLLLIAGGIAGSARAALVANYAELSRTTMPTAEVWIVAARARDPSDGPESVVEVRLVRAGRRVAVVRRRNWP